MSDNFPGPIPHDIQQKISLPDIAKGQAHVFLSGHDDDKEVIRHIKDQLTTNGFICLSDDDVQGSSFETVDAFIPRSMKIAVVMSESYLNQRLKYEHICSLTKNCIENRKTTITILHNINTNKVPFYAKDYKYISTSDKDFWKRFVEIIQTDIPLTASIEVSHVGEGLAYGYHHNYFKYVAPGLAERLAKSKYANGNIPVLKKLIILMPKSGDCFREIDSSSCITRLDKLDFKLTVAGCFDRDYHNSVWKVTDPANSQCEYNVVMEYATPLCTLYEMELSTLARLGKQGLEKEIEEFSHHLLQLLQTSGAEKDLVIPMIYDDRSEDALNDEHYLARIVTAKVREEMATNKC